MAKEKKQAKGLGDSIEQVLEVTGVAKVAKWLLGEDCGCDERKEKLNKLFPYVQPKCLQEDEYKFLVEWFSERRNQVRPTEQEIMLKIYNRVFNAKMQPTNCGSCIRDVINKLQLLVNEYEQ